MYLWPALGRNNSTSFQEQPPSFLSRYYYYYTEFIFKKRVWRQQFRICRSVPNGDPKLLTTFSNLHCILITTLSLNWECDCAKKTQLASMAMEGFKPTYQILVQHLTTIWISLGWKTAKFGAKGFLTYLLSPSILNQHPALVLLQLLCKDRIQFANHQSVLLPCFVLQAGRAMLGASQNACILPWLKTGVNTNWG